MVERSEEVEEEEEDVQFDGCSNPLVVQQLLVGHGSTCAPYAVWLAGQ